MRIGAPAVPTSVPELFRRLVWMARLAVIRAVAASPAAGSVGESLNSPPTGVKLGDPTGKVVISGIDVPPALAPATILTRIALLLESPALTGVLEVSVIAIGTGEAAGA